MDAIKQKLPVIIMIIGVILLCLFFSMTGSAQSAAEPDTHAAIPEVCQGTKLSPYCTFMQLQSGSICFFRIPN